MSTKSTIWWDEAYMDANPAEWDGSQIVYECLEECIYLELRNEDIEIVDDYSEPTQTAIKIKQGTALHEYFMKLYRNKDNDGKSNTDEQ